MNRAEWRDQCTWERCGLDGGFFEYRPSLPANITFTVCFGVAMFAYLALGICAGKKWMYYTFSMVFGCALEVIGYVARVLAYNDIYHDGPFLAQIVCLTIAPAFLAAGIYLCLKHIVLAIGPGNSRIPPHWYPKIFIPCDVVSLILQAAGGGYASIIEREGKDPAIGNHIMLAGLAWQVFTLLILMLLAADFAMRTLISKRKQKARHRIAPSCATMHKIWLFRGFLVALSLGTLLIFTRCVYRVVELSQGWSGYLISVERHFIVLEGAVVLAAVILLFTFHPGVCIDDEAVGSERGDRPYGSEGDDDHMWYRLRRTITTEEVLESRMRFGSKDEKLSPDPMGGISIH